MYFELISEVSQKETIATGASIRELRRLKKVYGPGRWMKMKGIATVCFADGFVTEVELHWYECNGIGKVETKVKRFVREKQS
jgi:hypothetical protein